MKTPFTEYLQQGMSNNHIIAKNDESKMMVGEAAKILTKKFKTKIYAKELECYSTEWHHAGVFKRKNQKSLSGKRVHFIDAETVESITLEQLLSNKVLDEQKLVKMAEIAQAKSEIMVSGFYFVWDYDYSGAHGKKRNHKVLKTYMGNELNKPNNFTTCATNSVEFIDTYFPNKKYYGWDEPKIEDFTNEKIAEKKELIRLEHIRVQQVSEAHEKAIIAALAKQKIVDDILSSMQGTFEKDNVDLKNPNVPWFIFSRYFPNHPIITDKYFIKNWVKQQTPVAL